MREIKFQLYNKKDKKMYLFDPRWGNYYHGDGWVGAIPIEEERVRYAPPNRVQLEPESCEWRQFTGLLDKNGQEIYEGDIVICFATGNSPAVVECNAPDGGYNLRGRDGEYIEIFYNEGLKVIGNIYENPELLKGEDK